MSDDATLVYLEPDDEITTVVRRLREAEGARVILVAPGRTKATTSAVALRLLAGLAREDGREIVLVGDASARSLAAEAGIPAVASVADARSLQPGATPSAGTPDRAQISVVRGERRAVAPLASGPAAPERAVTPAQLDRSDETRAVPVVAVPPPPRTPSRRGSEPGPRRRRVATPVVLAALALLILAGVAGGAVLLPGATIRIAPAGQALGPFAYAVTLPVAGQASGTLNATADGTATGDDEQLVAATGTVTFLNYSYVEVEIPVGTSISTEGGITFTTIRRVLAPGGNLLGAQQCLGVVPGEVSVEAVAVDPGEAGNVPAEAIVSVDSKRIDGYLRGFRQQACQRVVNRAAMAGGAATHRPKVEQADVDAAVTALRADLTQQLAAILTAEPGRLYPQVPAPEPEITIPPDLVGKVGEETFSLAGSLTYAQPYVDRADAIDAAREQLDADAGAVPDRMTVLPGSIAVTLGDGTIDGDAVRVATTVRAAAAPAVDEELVRSLVAGKSPDAARAALAAIGSATVEVWPGWVTEVTGLRWRIEVKVDAAVAPEASGSPQLGVPSASPGS